MHGYNIQEIRGKKSRPRGKMRGLVVDPLDVFELLRDTYKNIPIPNDAKFEGISIEKSGVASYIAFYYSTKLSGGSNIIVRPTDVNFEPMNHCFAVKPQQLVDILKYWFDGMVPSDAEVVSFNLNRFFTLMRIDVFSMKFPDTMSPDVPLLHLRYEAKQLHTVDMESKKTVTVEV